MLSLRSSRSSRSSRPSGSAPALFALAAASLVVAAACGGSVAEAPSGGDAGVDAAGGGQADGGAVTTAACAAEGGVCLRAGETAPPNRAKTDVPLCEPNHECWVVVGGGPDAGGDGAADGGAVCQTDADCNDDPSASSLLGRCFEGTCICRAPAHVQPSGKCGTARPPAECRASGGVCRQDPAECLEGQLQGGGEASMSCGDFVAAVCCYPAAACRTTVDFQCCGARAEPYEPICENGFRTCDAGAPTPVRRGAGCGTLPRAAPARPRRRARRRRGRPSRGRRRGWPRRARRTRRPRRRRPGRRRRSRRAAPSTRRRGRRSP